MNPVRVAVAGCGHWGRNFVRVFQQLDGCSLEACSDPNPKNLRQLGRSVSPGLEFRSTGRMLRAIRPDALVVATPATTHRRIVAAALESGADVFVEKPLATSVSDARRLVSLAKRKRRVLMVGHIFHYNRPLERLRAMTAGGKLGRLRYLYAVRTNFGPIRDDVNVLWDLAAHDVSIMLRLTGDVPARVSATGRGYVKAGNADVAFGTLYFRRRGVLGHFHVSWLDPHKVRRLTVIGTKRMALFDDVNTQEPLRLYNRGVLRDKVYGDFGQFQMMLRDGDIHVPHVAGDEPLLAECRHFLKCVRTRARPLTGGAHGLDVVRVVAALSASLKANGRPVAVR